MDLFHILKKIYLLGMERELRIVNLSKKKTIKSKFIENDKLHNRINDGKTDH